MRLNNIFDDIFGQQSKVKVLRFLIRTKGVFSGRDAARGAGISHQIAHHALQSLSHNHIVTMTASGRNIMYTLNFQNRVVCDILVPLFKYEENFLENTIRSIVGKIKRYVYSAILYGSIVERRDNQSSDVDICLIVKNKKQIKPVAEYFDEVNRKFPVSYGNIVSPYIIVLKEFRGKYKNKDRHIMEIVQKGRVVAGKTIGEALINE